MRDWASSGQIKVERAREHIRDLESEIAGFRNRNPYRVMSERNAQHGGTDAVVRVLEPVPTAWSAIASDAIHNLNVALDYMWQRAVHGSKVARGDYFPVCANPEEAERRFKGRQSGRVQQAVKVLRDAGAFSAANPFHAIREFDNTDKHDTISLVACYLPEWGIDIGRSVGARRPIVFRQRFAEWRSIEDGLVLYSLAATLSEVDVDHELPFEIVFGQPEALKGEPVIPAIQRLAQAVDDLASAFCAKGLIQPATRRGPTPNGSRPPEQ